jgi:hypothetical protein
VVGSSGECVGFTHAPVVKFTSIHTLLALTTHLDLEIHQVNIKAAFLNGKLNEEIYLQLSLGANTETNHSSGACTNLYTD